MHLKEKNFCQIVSTFLTGVCKKTPAGNILWIYRGGGGMAELFFVLLLTLHYILLFCYR
jgi:hypothetical protein